MLVGRHVTDKSARDILHKRQRRDGEILIVVSQQFRPALEPDDADHWLEKIVHFEDRTVTGGAFQITRLIDPRPDRRDRQGPRRQPAGVSIRRPRPPPIQRDR
jgi:hypothetical protein